MLNRIAGFCYAFIGGVAIAQIAGAMGPWWIWLAICAALAVAIGLNHRKLGRGDDSARAMRMRWMWFMLLACGVAGGIARQSSTDIGGDEVVGMVALDDTTGVRNIQPIDFGEAERIAIRKTCDGEFRIRVIGEIRKRVPVTDEHGVPVLHRNGRWHFRLTPAEAAVSEVLNVSGDISIGEEFNVDTPFSKITAIEVLSSRHIFDGAANHSVHGFTIVRRGSHIKSFAGAEGDGLAHVCVLGQVAEDPAVYANRTALSVQPYFIQTRENGPFFRVSGGQIQATVNNNVADYDRISVENPYGNDIVLRGSLELPAGAANPGCFDNREFLRRKGIFSTMLIWPRRMGAKGPPSSFDIVTPIGRDEPRHGLGLVHFSLKLRERMLAVIKKTLPYPVSSFVGGVTLGLRYGLTGTECALTPNMPHDAMLSHLEPCADFISEEFRRSGVNHVLAVSGLHVTIITALLLGIFMVSRLPRKLYVWFIIAALVIFAIITGGRPATLRAVIMHSIFLMLWAFMKQSMRGSVLVAAPVAAALILVQSPALLVDPSFTLSFGAILSLALLTGPFYYVLCGLRGNSLIALAVVIVLFHVVAAVNWQLFASPAFDYGFLLVCALIFWLAGYLKRKGLRPIGNYGFDDMPVAVSGFLTAQFAIQVGMMIPLSSFYFSRWAVSGAAANLLAIPLIGVVLQIAMLACLIGLVPGVGIWLALILNAGNYVVCMAFLLVTHYASALFPYPFVPRISAATLCIYYALLAVFVWWLPFSRWVKSRKFWRRQYWWGASAVAVAALVWSMPRPPAPDGDAHVDFISVGFGSAALIRTPQGKNILVDTGFASYRKTRPIQAERNVLPYLYRQGITALDSVVVLSDAPERISGLPFIVKNIKVNRVYIPDGASIPQPAEGSAIPFVSYPGIMAKHRPGVLNSLCGTITREYKLKGGMVICREDGKDGGFVVVAEPAADGKSFMLAVRNGKRTMVFAGDESYEHLANARFREFEAAGVSAVNVLVMPRHGAEQPRGVYGNRDEFAARFKERVAGSLGKFIADRGVTQVIFEFGNPSQVLAEYLDSVNARRACEAAEDYINNIPGGPSIKNTDRDGLIRITL